MNKPFSISSVLVICLLVFSLGDLKAQDTVHYTGKMISNIDYHHGNLRPAVGVHATQILRANRQHPELADGFGWTYNHASMIAHWNDTFYVSYISDSVGEHIPPNHTLLLSSKDGKEWSKPKVLFPIYKVPDGLTKPGVEGETKDADAIMHQRVGFYVSKQGRLLALGYYGIAIDEKDHPNDGLGIGRVVREIHKDGSFGPIHFIRYNSSWNKKLSEFPFYKSSKDKGFVKACDEILSDPLMMMQWVEEADRDDPLIPLKKQYKAFSYYHLDNGNVVGLWKHALTSISKDGGKNWEYTPTRAPGFINGNAKIWGQRTPDGRFATIYNPSEYRWPLAISNSDDGLNYTDLLLVHGEITPMRYGGNYKSYGPQYVRGILEGNGDPSDGRIWVTYSMNKEDIWVASIPAPVVDKVDTHPNEVFDQMEAGKELDQWNVYNLLWASSRIEEDGQGEKWLTLRDKDPFDYARVERVIPESKKLKAVFEIKPEQNDNGLLQIEFQDERGLPAIRLIFDEDGNFKSKSGARFRNIQSYEVGKAYKIELEIDVDSRSYTVAVNGVDKGMRLFHAPVGSLERVMFRTGDQKHFPTPDTPADQDYDLENAGEMVKEAVFRIKSIQTSQGN
ncbi:six-hairpin glycosidase [Belliella marina]|uniref:Six-hairpin glycosidase n=1 Tax=Belliella marina TaxID=1644146 RepID=A0ABW4VJI9_9BACT